MGTILILEFEMENGSNKQFVNLKEETYSYN